MRRVTPFLLALVISVGACREDPTGPPQDSAITPAVIAAFDAALSPGQGRSAEHRQSGNPVLCQKGSAADRVHAVPRETRPKGFHRSDSFQAQGEFAVDAAGRPPIEPERRSDHAQLVDPVKLIVDFQPAGLRFNPQDPADLRIRWNETNPDVNRDGVINQQDAALKEQLKIWRRESSTQPWTRTRVWSTCRPRNASSTSPGSPAMRLPTEDP